MVDRNMNLSFKKGFLSQGLYFKNDKDERLLKEKKLKCLISLEVEAPIYRDLKNVAFF